MKLQEGLLLAWGLLCIAGGLRNVFAPEKTIRSRNKWADRSARWMTFGLRRKGFGPFFSPATDLRLTFWGGVILTLAGFIVLAYLLVTWAT